MYSNGKEKQPDTTTKGKRLKPSKQEEQLHIGSISRTKQISTFLCSHSPDGESRLLAQARLVHLSEGNGRRMNRKMPMTAGRRLLHEEVNQNESRERNLKYDSHVRALKDGEGNHRGFAAGCVGGT